MKKVVEYTIVLLFGVLSVCIGILPHVGCHCYTARWIYKNDTAYLPDKSLTKMEAQLFCLQAHNANGFWEVVKLPEPSYTYPSSAGEVRLFVDTSAELKLVQDRANRMAELTRHTDSMRNLLDSALYYYTKESCAPSDSVHYWYLKLAKITHYKPH